MVTYCVTKMITTCSPMIGQCFETMIVASSDKEWVYRAFKMYVLETISSHLKQFERKRNLKAAKPGNREEPFLSCISPRLLAALALPIAASPFLNAFKLLENGQSTQATLWRALTFQSAGRLEFFFPCPYE